jgi:hypothetical protein
VWAFTPQTFEEARGRANSIVMAEVVSVAAGPDEVLKVSGHPNGGTRIPTQRIKLKVIKSHKGEDKGGRTIMLFKAGSGCFDVEGDPAYEVGERYLLMLEPGPPGTNEIISPEGRYRVKADETLEPVLDEANEVVSQLRGKKLKDVEPALEGRGPLPRG